MFCLGGLADGADGSACSACHFFSIIPLFPAYFPHRNASKLFLSPMIIIDSSAELSAVVLLLWGLRDRNSSGLTLSSPVAAVAPWREIGARISVWAGRPGARPMGAPASTAFPPHPPLPSIRTGLPLLSSGIFQKSFKAADPLCKNQPLQQTKRCFCPVNLTGLTRWECDAFCCFSMYKITRFILVLARKGQGLTARPTQGSVQPPQEQSGPSTVTAWDSQVFTVLWQNLLTDNY